MHHCIQTNSSTPRFKPRRQLTKGMVVESLALALKGLWDGKRIRIRDVPPHLIMQFCLTLFKTPLPPPLHFEYLVDFVLDGLGRTLQCSKIGQNKT